MAVIDRIEEQQAKLKAKNNVYWLGEQLKNICRAEPHAAELVEQDLNNPNMDLIHLEKKIKAYADSHKEGSQACVPPQVADKLIREFYGLSVPDPAAPQTAREKPVEVVSIFDLM